MVSCCASARNCTKSLLRVVNFKKRASSAKEKNLKPTLQPFIPYPECWHSLDGEDLPMHMGSNSMRAEVGCQFRVLTMPSALCRVQAAGVPHASLQILQQLLIWALAGSWGFCDGADTWRRCMGAHLPHHAGGYILQQRSAVRASLSGAL